MATEVLQRAAIIQKAEDLRMSSVKLATVQGFDVAAVVNLIVHSSSKEAVQMLIDDSQKLEMDMLRAHYTIKLIETRPGVSGPSIFPLLQDVEPDAIKHLSKESLSCILETITHGVANEASEVIEIRRCKSLVKQQYEDTNQLWEDMQRSLAELEKTLETVKSNHWHNYAQELLDLQFLMPQNALKRAQAGDITDATKIIKQHIRDLEAHKVTIHQDPESMALLQEDELKIERLKEDVERAWHEVSSYEERVVNTSVGEIRNHLRSGVNDLAQNKLSAALDAAEQSIIDVDMFLKDKTAFDAAVEAAVERASESLCSDVTLRTEAMLQSQDQQPTQREFKTPFRDSREQWLKAFDNSFDPVVSPIGIELQDNHDQFMEAYEQASRSVRPVNQNRDKKNVAASSGFASFEQVVQGEYTRLDAELQAMHATTLQGLQKRPAQYTDNLLSRMKRAQTKADKILNRMHDHMVASMINTSKLHAEQYVQECRANIRTSTPRHANSSLVDELAALDDEMLLTKAQELSTMGQMTWQLSANNEYTADESSLHQERASLDTEVGLEQATQSTQRVESVIKKQHNELGAFDVSSAEVRKTQDDASSTISAGIAHEQTNSEMTSVSTATTTTAVTSTPEGNRKSVKVDNEFETYRERGSDRPRVRDDTSNIEAAVSEPFAAQANLQSARPGDVLMNKPTQQPSATASSPKFPHIGAHEQGEVDSDAVVAKVPFQLSTTPTATTTALVNQSMDSTQEDERSGTPMPVDGRKRANIAEEVTATEAEKQSTEQSKEALNADVHASSTRPPSQHSDQLAMDMEPAEAPPPPTTEHIFRPSLFKSNIFKTIDK